MFTPYILCLKIAAALALVAGLFFAGHEVADHWREQGRQEVQVKWDADKLAREDAQKKAIAQRIQENIADLAANEAKNQEVINELRSTSQLQNNANQRIIADLRNHGGLRVPSSVCSGFASEANSTSAEGNYEAGTSRLPEQIENDLFQYAAERDQEIIQLGSCQKWIRDNGFYKDEK